MVATIVLLFSPVYAPVLPLSAFLWALYLLGLFPEFYLFNASLLFGLKH